jgi:hypothetical protein
MPRVRIAPVEAVNEGVKSFLRIFELLTAINFDLPFPRLPINALRFKTFHQIVKDITECDLIYFRRANSVRAGLPPSELSGATGLLHTIACLLFTNCTMGREKRN